MSKRLWLASALFLTVALASAITAQTPAQSLRNEDVVAMVKAGLSADTVELAIGQAVAAFDTSPGELIRLKTAGVPERVIQAMLRAGATDRGGSSPIVPAPAKLSDPPVPDYRVASRRPSAGVGGQR